MNGYLFLFIRHAADKVIPFLWHESVYAAVVFILTALIGKLLRIRPPRLQTGLWLLVFIRLVLPPDLSHPFSGRNLIGQLLHWPTLASSVELGMETESDGLGTTAAGAIKPSSSPARLDYLFFLFVLWGLGTASLTWVFLKRLHRYNRMIRAGYGIEKGRAHEILELWKNRLGVGRHVRLVASTMTVSPFTLGLFRPVILIPEPLIEKQHDSDLESVIAHELAHVKRWDDLWIKLQNLVQIVYFFHPIVWMAGNRLHTARECACDRLVLSQKHIDRTRSARGLINILKMQPFGPDCVALIPSFSNGRNSLLTRLQNMKGEHDMRITQKIVAACLLAGLAVFILPMAASSLPEKHQTENQAKPVEFTGDSIVVNKCGDHTTTTTFKTATPSIRLIMPVKGGEISSGFGMRKHPITGQDDFHNAIDIRQKKGTPVYAAADGKVLTVKARDFNSKGVGRFIVVQHDNGFQTTYTQLDSILVEEGAKIRQGQEIGLLGDSGLATGPHLHFEVRLNGESVDPEKYIR